MFYKTSKFLTILLLVLPCCHRSASKPRSQSDFIDNVEPVASEFDTSVNSGLSVFEIEDKCEEIVVLKENENGKFERTDTDGICLTDTIRIIVNDCKTNWLCDPELFCDWFSILIENKNEHSALQMPGQVGEPWYTPPVGWTKPESVCKIEKKGSSFAVSKPISLAAHQKEVIEKGEYRVKIVLKAGHEYLSPVFIPMLIKENNK